MRAKSLMNKEFGSLTGWIVTDGVDKFVHLNVDFGLLPFYFHLIRSASGEISCYRCRWGARFACNTHSSIRCSRLASLTSSQIALHQRLRLLLKESDALLCHSAEAAVATDSRSVDRVLLFVYKTARRSAAALFRQDRIRLRSICQLKFGWERSGWWSHSRLATQ